MRTMLFRGWTRREDEAEHKLTIDGEAMGPRDEPFEVIVLLPSGERLTVTMELDGRDWTATVSMPDGAVVHVREDA